MELGVGADADVGFAWSGGGAASAKRALFDSIMPIKDLRKKLLIYPITPVCTVGTGMSA